MAHHAKPLAGNISEGAWTLPEHDGESKGVSAIDYQSTMLPTAGSLEEELSSTSL